jgi:SAM-dependent methyltransferase
MTREKIREAFSRLSFLKPISKDLADHDYFRAFLKSKADIEKMLPIPLNESCVLIVGCGYRYPDVLFYSCFAKEVHGLDILDVFYRDGFLALWRDYRKRGKSVTYSLVSAFGKRNGLWKNYYKRISDISNLSFNHSNIKLTSYDGNRMPFENNKFDVVLSNAVLEHVLELKTFFRELGRVTKPGGLSYHLYHNYYSFSGGHYANGLCQKNPWGHLRSIYHTEMSHLNRATIKHISEIFSSVFEIKNVFQVSKDHSKKGVDRTFRYEGEEWLTEDIRDELAQFSDEQLLTRAYLIIGTKKKV